jgi:hypothetical protein
MNESSRGIINEGKELGGMSNILRDGYGYLRIKK